VPWRIASASDVIEDNLVQACAVVSIGVSDIDVAMVDNKKAVFVTLMDRIP
jgi:hypothetical protein